MNAQLTGAIVVRRKLVVLVLLTVLVSGCTAGRAFRKGRDAARAGDWDTAVSTTRARCRRTPTTRNTRSSSSGRRRTRRASTSSRARDLETKDQLDAALHRVPGRPIKLDPTEPARRRPRRGARAHHPRSNREVAAPAGDRQAPAAGAHAGRAAPQPGGPHAAQVQLQQLEPARHPELHRDDHRASTSSTTRSTGTSRTR